MKHNFDDPLVLLAQIVKDYPVVMAFWVFKKIGQPTVIGEIIAGNLGPRYWNVFSWFLAALFPR
jgi:Kef-type K+ transport system membrane component KefB